MMPPTSAPRLLYYAVIKTSPGVFVIVGPTADKDELTKLDAEIVATFSQPRDDGVV